ncbi:MAG TPA: type I-C CRISPR-associated protein Cas8c/Csd1 [Thermoanaerobaculia bacterium]|jgi:CRISPR-associated protein Csd1|nr:type I-C CRISPR-associated protein Cas8c/Csd1 [Thermoanaerobaculia bacterium]
MLDHLVTYARTHGLVAEPGFAPKTARWAILCDPAGAFQEVLDLADPEEKGSPGRTFPRCPELSQPEIKRGGAGCRHFLVDSADVVALHAAEAPDAKLHAKHAYFTGLLRQAAEVMPRLAGVAAMLDDEASLQAIRDRLLARKAKPTDKATFAIFGESPLYPVESDAWHDWWRRFRRTLGTDPAAPPVEKDGVPLVRCLASGELVEPVATQPKIAGLSDVGGLAMGDVLASFKQDAFCSYGFVQAANAPVSEQIGAEYRAALNHLLREHSHRLVSAKVVHWFKERVPPEDDPLSWLAGSDEQNELNAQQRARELLDAIRTGQRPSLAGNRYYALTLSGASGRVMIRDWMEGQFEDLVQKISAWFDHLSIVRRDGQGLAPSPKLFAVFGALVRDLKDLPAPLETALWRVAVRGEAIPWQAMAQALARMKIDILGNETLNHARVGLLKAFHVRQGDREMHPNLNEEHPEPAYHCGRLMALFAALQYRALGDVGAGVVQRYYAAASATPALVLGRLNRTAQFHLNKLDPGLARWYERRLASLWACIRDRVPRTLSLEQQSLFALGYYQQIASDRAGTVKPDSQETEVASGPQETSHD